MKPWTFLLLLPLLAACDINRAASLADGGAATDTHMGPADSAPPVDTLSPSCAGMSSFAAGKRVASFYTRKALIDPGLKRAWLLSHKDNADGDLYEMSLPSGKLVKRGSGFRDIAWMGKTEYVLATRPEKGSTGSYDLFVTGPGSGAASQVNLRPFCVHKFSDDGRYMLHLFDCKDNLGELHLEDTKGGLCTALGKKVSRWGLAMTPDASVIAYRQEISTASSCKQGTGTLRLHHYQSNTKVKVAGDVHSYGVQFTPDSKRLLFRQRVSCVPSKDRLLATGLAAAKPVKLTEKASYGFFGHFDPDTGDWTMAVSPDSSRALLADLDMSGGKDAKLVSVRVDGKGEQVLASDLFNYHTVSAAMRAWAYTPDGKQVVYLTGNKPNVMGLAAVPAAGGKARTLSKALGNFSFVLSRQGGKVAFIEGGYSGPNTLLAADLNSGAKPATINSSAYRTHGLGWTGDGRGLLWTVQSAGPKYELMYGPHAGGKVVTLGSWKTQYFQGRRPYATDKQGCLVLHNRQESGASGTYIRQLP